ncbi:hypothetical protein T03_11954 [Trichinella britovi]|uniref:Uncharacterized protein n=1 Tax=Trichinella britovi TaxID=45882 RepID=A0A0V1D4A3_TRIBR|nr:hypothetical protein T06_12059 [Trichinella sp. T6]KRY56247.1 hypothetical protein T03_11954 [Trichinella britovi]
MEHCDAGSRLVIVNSRLINATVDWDNRMGDTQATVMLNFERKPILNLCFHIDGASQATRILSDQLKHCLSDNLSTTLICASTADDQLGQKLFLGLLTDWIDKKGSIV